MSEKRLRKKCIEYLRTVPRCMVTSIIPGPYGGRGISDLLICLDGKFIAIELKHGKNKATALQEKYLRDVRESGGVAVVCRSIKDLERVVKEAK